MILLKLGGSVITDKTKRFSVRRDVLERIAGEVRDAGFEEGLIIVHGGGSFGHPIAMEYGLHRGAEGPAQLSGIALTRKAMEELNSHVVGALVEAEISAVALQPSANVICKGGRIQEINLRVIEGVLKLGLVPVLYGDVVLDEEQGFCILSGDQIVSYLSRAFEPDKIVLAADIDGIFDRDPKRFEDAKLLPEFAREDLDAMDLGPEADATGGIGGKLRELLALAEEGFDSQIINGLEEDRLRKALLGGEVIGTWIRGRKR